MNDKITIASVFIDLGNMEEEKTKRFMNKTIKTFKKLEQVEGMMVFYFFNRLGKNGIEFYTV